jgi:hypothetical protein
MNDEKPDLPLSDDPQENLRIENELMKLKMQAELGASSFSDPSLDPEIENVFLKNVMAFEQRHAGAKPMKVADLLGNPEFKPAAGMDDEELALELARLESVLAEKSIDVYFGDGYDDRTKYSFITEELFDHETTFMPMPGMMTCFDYEEFHPNHKKDIENRADEFIKEWFERSINERSWELADHFILPDRTILPKAEVVAKMQRIFEAYTGFVDCKYKIIESGFELNDDSGVGHAGGAVKYDAVLENGEQVRIGGPFKLYMSNEGGWWSIFHIVFPGFKYF